MTTKILNPDTDVELYRTLRLKALETDPSSFHLTLTSALKKPSSFFVDEIKDSRFGCFMVLSDDEPVAMVVLRGVPGGAKIYNLYVHPDYRTRGIATNLLKNCEERAKKYRVDKIELTVMPSNPALSLYQKNGFKVVGVVDENTGELSLSKRVI